MTDKLQEQTEGRIFEERRDRQQRRNLNLVCMERKNQEAQLRGERGREQRKTRTSR
jgi:hypothetical protein